MLGFLDGDFLRGCMIRNMLSYLENNALTNLLGYAIIKIMKRDFWNGIRPLGHMTLLVSQRILK
jgi:hypothetical protein